MNFLNTNWEINQSPDKEENDALNFIDRLNAEQIVDKTLDVVLIRNNVTETHIENKLEKIYNLSDHRLLSIKLFLNVLKNKPIHECYYNSAEQIMMKSASSCSPNLFNLNVRNIMRMNIESEEYRSKIIQKFVPRKTAHRQSVPVWYEPSTSILLKRLKILRMLYSTKPTPYRKQKFLEHEKIVFEEVERNKTDYQNILFSDRITVFRFKHLKPRNILAKTDDEGRLGKNSKQYAGQN